MNRSNSALFGAAILALILILAIFAPWAAPFSPFETHLAERLQPPSCKYFFGTDQLGRCVFSRTLFAGRLSITIAVAASVLSLSIGAAFGIAAGLGNRTLDFIIGILTDAALALPGLIIAIVLTGLAGPSNWSLVTGLSAFSWAWWARFIRSIVLSAREKEFVIGAKAVGVRGRRLLFRYILPQLREPVIAAASLKTGWLILAVSGLSYLGLGAQPPAPEWGTMLQESRIYAVRAPWMLIAPGAAITLTVMAFNLVGEGIGKNGKRI